MNRGRLFAIVGGIFGLVGVVLLVVGTRARRLHGELPGVLLGRTHVRGLYDPADPDRNAVDLSTAR